MPRSSSPWAWRVADAVGGQHSGVSSRPERGNGNRLAAGSTRRFLNRHDLATEWAQAHSDELEVRKTKGDPDDRKAEQDAAEDVN